MAVITCSVLSVDNIADGSGTGEVPLRFDSGSHFLLSLLLETTGT